MLSDKAKALAKTIVINEISNKNLQPDQANMLENLRNVLEG